MKNTTLGELGERYILNEIIPQYASGVGDDCAVSAFYGPNLAITTDPVPTPGALLFAGNDDPYYLGWLSVVINVSDLGSSGAKPEVLVASIEVPSTTFAYDFERMLLGIKEASDYHNIRFVGGNLKEAEKINITICAVGSVAEPFLRKGAAIGDEIIALGNGGHFWRDVLLQQSGEHLNKTSSALFKPKAQASNIQKLRQNNFNFSCAMDASDGLVPTLFELTRSNSLGIDLFVDRLIVKDTQLIGAVDSRLLWLGWGDWEFHKNSLTSS